MLDDKRQKRRLPVGQHNKRKKFKKLKQNVLQVFLTKKLKENFNFYGKCIMLDGIFRMTWHVP